MWPLTWKPALEPAERASQAHEWSRWLTAFRPPNHLSTLEAAAWLPYPYSYILFILRSVSFDVSNVVPCLSVRVLLTVIDTTASDARSHIHLVYISTTNMKFGKNLARNQVPEWEGNYIKYKALKKLINSAAELGEHGQEPDLASRLCHIC